MQVVTYIERKSIFPDVSSKKAIPLPDLFTFKEFNQQSKFKPGEHYQRITTMDTRSLESKSTLKRGQLPETKNKEGQNKVKKRTWTSLIVPTEEPSGRGDQKQ